MSEYTQPATENLQPNLLDERDRATRPEAKPP